MDIQILISELVLVIETGVLIILAYHIYKLEKNSKFLLNHLNKLDDHITMLNNHISKIEKHVDKLDNHSTVMDYHLKNILDRARIQHMSEKDREELIKGITSREEEEED